MDSRVHKIHEVHKSFFKETSAEKAVWKYSKSINLRNRPPLPGPVRPPQEHHRHEKKRKLPVRKSETVRFLSLQWLLCYWELQFSITKVLGGIYKYQEIEVSKIVLSLLFSLLLLYNWFGLLTRQYIFTFYISQCPGESLVLPQPIEMFPFCFQVSVIWMAGRSFTGTRDEAGLPLLLPLPDF